jgi:DNA-binding LacI/PurR family transcriptional regulator
MRAAQMVLDVVLDRTTKTVNLLLPPELVRRASTGPPSGDR